MQVAYDADTGNVWLGQDNVWAGGGDPALGISPTFTVTANTQLFLGGATQNTRMNLTLNAGTNSFDFSPPTDFTGRWSS
jgi:hypothetical protein